MTIDKYIAIKWPHRAAVYSSRKRARVIIVTVFTFTVLYNSPHFFMTALVEGECYGYSVKSILTKVYSWFTIFLNAVIPFTLLIHMNYVIVKTGKTTVGKCSEAMPGTTGTETRQKTMKNTENQLTTMLLLVTTLFLFLLLPTYVRFIYASFVITDTPSKYASSLFFFEITYKLYVTNSAINFFLYCISGQRFRNDLKEIVCCIRKVKFFPKESNSGPNTQSTIS